MTNSELSNEFDVLYNNITSNQAPGLNEYEKSVFLTKAQSQLVNEYFNNRTDGFGGGFDGSQKRQYDFSSITRVANLYNVNSFKERITALEKLDRRSEVFLFPQDYFLAVNEILSDNKTQYSVLPINHTDYQRLILKPYSYPVKRAAWRIITDKKNCNYIKVTPDSIKEASTNSNISYVIMSSWADRKRNIELTIGATRNVTSVPSSDIAKAVEVKSILLSDGTFPKVYIEEDYIIFEYIGNFGEKTWGYLELDTKWKDDNLTYIIKVTLQCGLAEDDEDTINVLKQACTLAKHYLDQEKKWDNDWDSIKAITHIDGFMMCSAPSKFNLFTASEDNPKAKYTFTTKIVQIPMVEIIGKFNNEPNYQLRYIKTLNPIITDNLEGYGENISINGISEKTECELPEETHQEILERAVTLAKIAWQGGTLTQATQSKED